MTTTETREQVAEVQLARETLVKVYGDDRLKECLAGRILYYRDKDKHGRKVIVPKIVCAKEDTLGREISKHPPHTIMLRNEDVGIVWYVEGKWKGKSDNVIACDSLYEALAASADIIGDTQFGVFTAKENA